MRRLVFFVACIAPAACGSRVQIAGNSDPDRRSSVLADGIDIVTLQIFARFLLTARPAAQWQFNTGSHSLGRPESLRAVFDESYCPTLPGSRCPPPQLMAKKYGIGENRQTAFRSGYFDEAVEFTERVEYAGVKNTDGYAADRRAKKPKKMSPEKEEEQRVAVLRGKVEFQALKRQLVQDQLFNAVLCTALVGFFFNLKITLSFLLGGLFGTFYIYLEGASAEGVGAEVFGGTKKRLPPAIVAPVLLVFICIKQKEYVGLIPGFIGFNTFLLTIVGAALYPKGWGVPEDWEPPPKPEVVELPSLNSTQDSVQLPEANTTNRSTESLMKKSFLDNPVIYRIN